MQINDYKIGKTKIFNESQGTLIALEGNFFKNVEGLHNRQYTENLDEINVPNEYDSNENDIMSLLNYVTKI